MRGRACQERREDRNARTFDRLSLSASLAERARIEDQAPHAQTQGPRQRAGDLHTRPARSEVRARMTTAKQPKNPRQHPAGDAAARMTTAEADGRRAHRARHRHDLRAAGRAQRSLVRRAVQGRRPHPHHPHAAMSRARPTWRSAPRSRPASRRPMRWCRARACSIRPPRLLTAYGMNAPVLALIGQISQAAIGRGLGHLHEIRDQAGIIARLVDFCARIREPSEAAALVAEALRAMGTGRPGPAVLECAMDVWGRSAPDGRDRAAFAAAAAADRRGRDPLPPPRASPPPSAR